MSAPVSSPVLAVCLYLVPTLLWVVLCERISYFVRTRKPRSQYFRILPLLTGALALYYLVNLVWVLVPVELYRPPHGPLLLLWLVGDLAAVAAVALATHLLRVVPLRAEPPGTVWLACNYGLMLAAAAATIAPLRLASTTEPQARAAGLAFSVYAFTMFVLNLGRIVRIARRGAWAPGAISEVRVPDLVVLATGLLAMAGGLAVVVTAPQPWEPSLAGLLVDVTLGVLLAVPLAVRMLQEVIRRVVIAAAAITATGTVYLGTRALSGALAGPGFGPLLDLGTVLGLVLLLVPGQAWLLVAVDRVLLRRTQRRLTEVQALLHALPVDLGLHECCRRALADVSRVMQLRGAAIVLDDGETVVHGSLDLEPVRRVWPPGEEAARLLGRGFGLMEMRELPLALKEALAEADVVGVFPVASPRRLWGTFFLTTGLLGMVIGDDDAEVYGAFTDQLALVLDGAELLARAVAVERSLAHAEKLAAIGELAARIAHEIRNPVAAARSLTQQLAREPGTPHAVEHGLILTELERVERQVAALLRFARRDEFRFEPLDLGELVAATVAAFRSRLEAAGIRVALEAPAGVTVRADREKLRQVVVNLLENALDALAGHAGERSLSVAVGNGDAGAVLRLRDTGPGVPAEALPHLFEPFFSLKETGTGLGLAIAKRTVEAHGGRIAGAGGAGAGMTFEIALPREDTG